MKVLKVVQATPFIITIVILSLLLRKGEECLQISPNFRCKTNTSAQRFCNILLSCRSFTGCLIY